MAWVESKYLVDRKRSPREIKAALLALSVHGDANGAIPRERVIQSYRMFMNEHPDIAGYVAPDLAAWQYWDAVPDYLALMKSDVRQQYPSRLAISPTCGKVPSPSRALSLESASPRTSMSAIARRRACGAPSAQLNHRVVCRADPVTCSRPCS